MNSRKVIVDILDSVLFHGAYSNIELNKRLNESNLNDKDKALVTEVIYGTVKYKKTIDFIISSFVKDINKIDKKLINVLRSAIYQIRFLDKIPDYAIVNEAVNLAKRVSLQSSKFVNGVLRNYLRNKDKDFNKGTSNIKRLAFEYSMEEWMVELFIRQYGEEVAKKILLGLNSTPDVTVRVNQLKKDYDDVFEQLKIQGYEVEEGFICPEAINIIKGRNIEVNPLFKEGCITVQDESAMLVAPSMDLEDDLKVLDLCSAPGGKTTHIGELMNNHGGILAFDVYDHKLELIKENCKRLGLTNIEAQIMDATKLNSAYVSCADRVLIDVPCSGLGIIRKKPEIKWTKSPKDLKDIIDIQRKIMENGWNYVKPNGIMLYSTCTLNKKENEENIQWFLSKHKDAVIEKLFVGKADNLIYNNDGSLTIIPNSRMDGFYIAKLMKRGR
ncbi:ribosomal RNA small subunit methyltransferase B [Clostridium polyendosporum]|uniref:16S rRNA (cytosine(967)-C(5))-methyltransferase n=1 Tax=Clostridium polyendosporum TaxID=69208 RepID=A0A919VF81_9CLOT|nr:16S rRNA (cytosine(967)-C(5))-methyltransferase RsmB [Clostridium polyendosporum]GIM27857.1 ribosomal RNA small subunit methyltransferase B [Clostridium polyendosporum]